MAPKNKQSKDKDSSADANKSKGGKGGTGGGLKPATSINVRHILCEKHSKKEQALEKLRNGAKFDDVAKERVTRLESSRELDGAFEKVAYELEPSTTANPKYVEVKTGFGYHIIMVEGRK
ncbi:Peptidyl-prolyl cis-trans isomerase [Aspergillus sclerotialis]|uniref:Peptidyl-prolyl cis-trans isomerase n=1 Tax=Aspergillus sclerotialis TaxID=2070753 RepID=A0A3A2Z8D2_9EURO|nr:Peptidyl-prolyl cis-trans isomerase [Aspergillus sclerotialis]